MTNNKQQTAVEWFAMKLAEKLGMPNAISFYVDNEKEILQAKEMERGQKMNDFIAGMEFIAVDPNRYKEDAEQYYKQTYGGGEQ
jgi:hypothetical protein